MWVIKLLKIIIVTLSFPVFYIYKFHIYTTFHREIKILNLIYHEKVVKRYDICHTGIGIYKEFKIMIRINDLKEKEKYILKYRINDMFTKDMNPFIELFFFKKMSIFVEKIKNLTIFFFL